MSETTPDETTPEGISEPDAFDGMGLSYGQRLAAISAARGVLGVTQSALMRDDNAANTRQKMAAAIKSIEGKRTIPAIRKAITGALKPPAAEQEQE